MTGMAAALAAAFFMGLNPVLGKMALAAGLPAFGVAALRTVLAALLMGLWLRFWRPGGFYIHPIGLVGALLAGALNGLGSLFFFLSLKPLGAALGQLLFSLHPVFLILWVWLDREPISRLSLLRVALAIPTVVLLTRPTGTQQVALGPAALMLLASALYALHVPINRRVLYEAPAPTVTFYTLLSMSGVVVLAYLVLGPRALPTTWTQWKPLVALGLSTFLSRLTLFMGVKRLGSLQTMLVSLAEIGVSVLFAHLWLGETLTPTQFAGLGLLVLIVVLGHFDRPTAPRSRRPGGWLQWLQPPHAAAPWPR